MYDLEDDIPIDRPELNNTKTREQVADEMLARYSTFPIDLTLYSSKGAIPMDTLVNNGTDIHLHFFLLMSSKTFLAH